MMKILQEQSPGDVQQPRNSPVFGNYDVI